MRSVSDTLNKLLNYVIEYETPKVVTVHNVSIGLIRRGLQILVVLYVTLYQLWYAQGYQEFSTVESSTTTKVKGYSVSSLGEFAQAVPPHLQRMYERVWDEADYVVPPAENGAFFVTTNVVITPNQTRGYCPEDPVEVSKSICHPEAIDNSTQHSSYCTKGSHFRKSHGPCTGRCVKADRHGSSKQKKVPHVCEIQSWCPVEDDRLVLGKGRPLITGSENHTAFIKNSIRFSYFGDDYHRNNMPDKVCVYNFSDAETWMCNIFKLGDMVRAAGGDYNKLSVGGGVVAIHIQWICNLDWDFMKYCLPKYNFRLLDTSGWNFRHAHYHEEGRRTLYKAYGIKFVIIVQGRAGKFSLKDTVINIVAGLGLISFITMFCDFIMLNYVSERKIIKQKKFEVLDRRMMFNGLMALMSVTGAVPDCRPVTSSEHQNQSRETLTFTNDFTNLQMSPPPSGNRNGVKDNGNISSNDKSENISNYNVSARSSRLSNINDGETINV